MISPGAGDVWDGLPGQSLVALLALVGSKKMEIGELRRRTKLSQGAFGELFSGFSASASSRRFLK